MPRSLINVLVFATILLFPLKSFCDQAVMFQRTVSIYSDDKEKGLLQPEGLDCTDKSLVIADTGNNRLLQYTLQGDTIQGGSQIQVSQLSYPVRVQINSKGEILVLDGKNRRIVRLKPDGEFSGYLEPKGVPTDKAVVPRSFKIDRSDNIYILDIFSGRVIVLNAAGEYQRQVEFPKEFGFFSDLVVDSRGMIYLVDSANSMIYSAAKESGSFSPLTANMKEYMRFPTCITTDNKGLLYVTDQNGGSIVLVGLDGSFRGRQLGMGWNEGLLNYPVQMCVSESGQAFIADRNNNRVQGFR